VDGALGLLLGGLLTEHASWRWCLYVNLVIAAVALVGALRYLREGERPAPPAARCPWRGDRGRRLRGPVYGLGDAESHGWWDSLTLGPVVVGLLMLAVFVLLERRAEHPLLPIRVVLDGNRGGGYLSAGIAGAGMFGIFLFLTYYLTGTLHFSPVATGAAFLPMIAALMVSATAAGSVLVPRTGPRPLVSLAPSSPPAACCLLTRLDLDSAYTSGVLPALLLIAPGSASCSHRYRTPAPPASTSPTPGSHQP
jgi:MFS family permease